MDEFESELARDAEAMRREPLESDLAALRVKGKKLVDLEKLIDETDEKLKALKRERLELSQREIPDLLDAAGVDRIGIPEDGVDVKVLPFYKANIPPENIEEATKWLEDNGHGELMRTTVSVNLAPGEREHAVQLSAMIRAYFRSRNITQIEPSVESGVHWKTLSSFVQERTELGEALPLSLLGATIGRVAKIEKRRNK